MTTPRAALEEIEEIRTRIASNALETPEDLENALRRLEYLREQLNERRRESEGSIGLARAELQDAITEEQNERLA